MHRELCHNLYQSGASGELTQFFICGLGVQGQQRQTHCQSTHNIYVDTRLDTNCGIVSATLDGGAPVTLDCYYPTATTSQMRRLLFSGVAAGQHEVVITISGNKNASSQGWYFYFYFYFLESFRTTFARSIPVL